MSWQDIPDFVDNTMLMKDTFQQLLDNVQALKFTNDYRHVGESTGTQTVGTTLTELTDRRWKPELELTHGGDVLVFARVLCNVNNFGTVNNSNVGFSLYVDGELYQGDGTNYETGFFLHTYNTALKPVWIVRGLSPGRHVFELYAMRYGADYTLTVRRGGRSRMFAIEL